jgi:hypothetical protein
MAIKTSQITDQTIKGAALGAVAYVCVKANLDAEAQAVIVTAATTLLAYLSTKIGDPKVASFLAKAVKELPKVAEEVKVEAEKQAVAKKAPAKKAPAKKAPAKKS